MSRKTLSVTFTGRLNRDEGTATIGYIIDREDTNKTLAEVGEDISDSLYLNRVGPTYMDYCALIEALRTAQKLVDSTEFSILVQSNNLSVLRCVNPRKHNSSIKLGGMVNDAQSELDSFRKPAEFEKISNNRAGGVADDAYEMRPV